VRRLRWSAKNKVCSIQDEFGKLKKIDIFYTLLLWQMKPFFFGLSIVWEYGIARSTERAFQKLKNLTLLLPVFSVACGYFSENNSKWVWIQIALILLWVSGL
jgi:hypothetical protein